MTAIKYYAIIYGGYPIGNGMPQGSVYRLRERAATLPEKWLTITLRERAHG